MTEQLRGSDIAARQDLERNLRRQSAARVLNRREKRISALQRVVALIIAAAGQVTFFTWPEAGVLISAAASIWLFTSRLLLEPLQRRERRRGAICTEEFDTRVLGIDPPPGFETLRLAEEEVYALSEHTDIERYSNWYTVEEDTVWPRSVLLCQRTNAVWGRRQHRTYAWILLAFTIVVGLAGIVLAVSVSSTVAAYLLGIAIPSLPLLLDFADLSQRHHAAARARLAIEEEIRAHWTSAGGTTLRAIQDRLFETRSQAPQVPQLLYLLLRGPFQRAAGYAATEK